MSLCAFIYITSDVILSDAKFNNKRFASQVAHFEETNSKKIQKLKVIWLENHKFFKKGSWIIEIRVSVWPV